MQLAMRRPAGLPVPSPEASASVRHATPEDTSGLTRLLAASFPEMTWDEARSRRALLEAADVDAVFVATDGPSIIATASARYSAQFPDEGYVHWVAVDPARRGQNLSQVMLACVLREFEARGLPAILQTDDERLPAIAAYLRDGFIPAYLDTDHQLRWSAVFTQLAEWHRKARNRHP